MTKSEAHCLFSNTCTPQYPSGETRTKILKCFTISAVPYILTTDINMLA